MRPARPHCAQEEREPHGSPSSCESPSPLSGRAARVKVSDAFHLPPACHCDRQGIGCHPRGVQGRIVRPHGTRPERRLHANSNRKPCIASTPASRVSRKTFPPRRYRKSNFPQNVENLFAVAGIREHPPAGVIRKRGRSAPSCAPVARSDTAPAARRRRNPAREARALPVRLFKAKSSGRALCAPTGESQRRTP